MTFPTTLDSATASSAAHSLYSALNTNPGQVYTASGAQLLTSATVAITDASLATSPVPPRPSVALPPGVAPVQFLLSGDLTCDPTCVASSGRKLLASGQTSGLVTKLQHSWHAVVGPGQGSGRGLAALPCCTTAPASTQVDSLPCCTTALPCPALPCPALPCPCVALALPLLRPQVRYLLSSLTLHMHGELH